MKVASVDRKRIQLLGCVSALTLAASAVPLGTAAAQEVCFTNFGFSGTATNNGDLACGKNSKATGNGTDAAVAVGSDAQAIGGGATALGDDVTATGSGAVALGGDDPTLGPTNASKDRSTAVGAGAQATGEGATAVGRGAVATADFATAVGGGTATPAQATAIGASAFGNNATATAFSATALGTEAHANAGQSIAIGRFATTDLATGSTDSIAIGTNASTFGPNSVAMGINAVARGGGSVAIGGGAETGKTGVAATQATALGANSKAQGNFSSAFGTEAGNNAANPTAVNEMRFGVAAGEVTGTLSTGNTYTMGGITSAASQAAQSGPLQLVTTDAAGHLASDNGTVARGIAKVQAGVAISLALEAPSLTQHENFGIRLGWGNLDGDANAWGLSAMGVLCRGCMGAGTRLALDGGVGFSHSEFAGYRSESVVAGRAGIQLTWK